MIKPIIVVTVGRCGSSYVASALDKMGVFVGENLVSADSTNPAGHWEDQEFKQLNLGYLEGDLTLSDFRQGVKDLVAQRGGNWGFKVPSTSEVLKEYLDILENAKVVWCQRPTEEIKESMMNAYGWSEEVAQDLIDKRLEGIETAIEHKSPPLLQLTYEEIFNDTEQMLDKLADFCETQPTDEQKQKALNLKIDKLEEKPKVWISVLNQGNMRPGLSNVLTQMTHDSRAQVHIDYPNVKPEVGNRNKIANNFMDSDYDFLMTIDSDIVPRKNPLDLVFLNKDIINCAAPQWRDGDMYWVAMDEDGEGWKPFPPEKRRSLQQVDATGQACIVYKREVFEKLDDPPFYHITHDDGTIRGQEFLFCERARERGMKVWVHFDYFASHFKKLDLLEVFKLLGENYG